MKLKNLFTLILVFAFLLLISPHFASAGDRGSLIIVQVMRYEPFPAEPGDYLDIWINVENRGDKSVKDFELELISFYPFTIFEEEYGKTIIANLGPFESKLLKFRVRVDQKAMDEEYFLRYKYKYTGRLWEEAGTSIKIYSINRELSINSITSNPEQIIPGEVSEIRISFKNNADSMIRYVKTQLSLIYEESATRFIELPFTPISGGSEKTIYSIPAGEETDVIFNLMADPDAKAGPYKIPIRITYFDRFGTEHIRTEIIGLVVNSEPDMYVVVEKTSITRKGQSGNIFIKFINKGLTDIKFLNVNIPENKNVKVIGPSNQYVGDVDSDDYETISYRIVVQKTDKRTVLLPLNIEYRDANNQLFVEQLEIPFVLYSASEKGESDKSPIGIVIIFLILVVVGMIIYKKWEKKKKNKK